MADRIVRTITSLTVHPRGMYLFFCLLDLRPMRPFERLFMRNMCRRITYERTQFKLENRALKTRIEELEARLG